MSFLLTCPNCGDRNVNEFQYGGEVTSRPAPGDEPDQWTEYFYARKNTAGGRTRVVESPLRLPQVVFRPA